MPENGMSTTSSDEEEGVTVSHNKGRKNRTLAKNYNRNELLRKAIVYIDYLDHRQERDEADIYGEGWVHSYRKLSARQKLFAKKAIDEIFILGQLGKLTLNSVVTDMLE